MKQVTKEKLILEVKALPAMLLTQEVRELWPHLGKKIVKGDGLWDLWRRACASSFFFSLKTILNQTPPELDILTWRTHGVVAKLCEHEELRRVLHEEPRKSLKSSIVTVRKPWWRLLKKAVRGEDLSDRNFILSHGFEVAQKHWWDQKEVWEGDSEGSRLFRFLFSEEIRVSSIWSQDKGCLERAWHRKDMTFEPLAKKFAGKHCDWLGCDDLVDEENFDSESAVEKAVSYLKATKNVVEGPESIVDVVGNRWGLNDVNAHIHKLAEKLGGWVVLSISATRGPRIDEPFGCRNLPDDVMELAEAQREFAEVEGTIWPERFSRAYLDELREDLGAAIYSAQYENMPEDPENRDFEVELIGEAEITTTEDDRPAWKLRGGRYGTEEVLVAMDSCDVTIGWDPAADGKRAKSKNAIVAIAATPKRDVVVLKEYEKKENPLQSVKRFIAFCRLFRGWLAGSGVEEVNFQRIFKDLLRESARKMGVALKLRKVKTPTGKSKEQRMRVNLSGIIEGGRLFLAYRKDLEERKICQTPRLRNALGLVGVVGAVVDLPDALSYAVQIAKWPEGEKEVREREEEERREEERVGITGYGEDFVDVA